jgi:hypothetical protein
MTFTPNIEAARKRFVERVALAYFNTWGGYGFVGPEFTYERATEIAENLAQYGFPLPRPTIVTMPISVDTSAIREIIERETAAVREVTGIRSVYDRADYEDGVTGD